MKSQLKSARRCGVPLVAITTRDQQAAIKTIVETINSNSPVIQYDCVTGLRQSNEEGYQAYLSVMTIPPIKKEDEPESVSPELMTDPVTVLQAICERAPVNTVIIMIGADRYLTDVRAQQAVINCRDPFKSSFRMVVLLSTVQIDFPADLADDILQIEEPAPDDEQRKNVILRTFQDAKQEAKELKDLSEETLTTAISATRALSPFCVEQSTALSLSKNGLDTESLWQRWRKSINSTPGLTVDTSGTTLDDIGGLQNFKDFAYRIMNGRKKPSAIIRVEEIEKVLASSGYGGDSSGTSQKQLQYLLTYMQEEDATGMIAYGPAGGGKSMASVAMGSIGGIPTITADIAATENSLVGQSGKNMRRMLSTIKSLAGKGTFWIATCNSLYSLPPELRRRFQYGIWFFDLLTELERDAVWKIWLRKYPEVPDIRPDDEGWTGAEIRTAVQTAYNLNCTPREAAQWIVPVCRMAAETIDGLRKQANNRYLCANYPGTYRYNPVITAAASSTGNRKMDLQ